MAIHDARKKMLVWLKLALIAASLSLVVSVALLLAIGYCVFTSQWLPAIFLLLARKELVTYLDGVRERIEKKVQDNHA